LGFRVNSSGLRVRVKVYNILDVGFGIQGSEFRAKGSRFMVSGFRFRVYGQGFRARVKSVGFRNLGFIV